MQYNINSMKKKLPLTVLEILEPFLSKKGNNYELAESGEYLLQFKDKDKASDFYFRIMKYKNGNELLLLIEFKPASKDSVENTQTWVRAGALEPHFTNWISLLDRYDKVKSIFDDPIIDAFKNEYYADWELVDEDADIAPFSPKKILLLDEHLEYIESNIEKYKTETNEQEILEIKSNVSELRKNLTKKSKAWVVNNLSNIWAKITKQGPGLLKEFISEAKKEIIKGGAKYLIEQATEIIRHTRIN